MQGLDAVEQVEQADRVLRSTADVECLPPDAQHVPLREQERIHQVVDEQDVADLLAVAVEGDRRTF
jgi:hypothetical protein